AACRGAAGAREWSQCSQWPWRLSRRCVRQRLELRREALARGRLGIGGAVVAQLPRGGEAARVEPGEQPHQQLVARQALFGDQLAFVPDLLGAAVDRAIEGDRREAPDGELVGGVPRRGERG